MKIEFIIYSHFFKEGYHQHLLRMLLFNIS